MSLFFGKLFLFVLMTLPASAYVPPAKMILSRLVENNGNGVYQIEQDVQLLADSETLSIRETWITGGEKGVKLIAVGQNELKDKFYYQALYSGGLKWVIESNQGNRPQKVSQTISREMTERPFHIRSTESIVQWLTNLEILPANFLQQKPFVKEKESFVYLNEPYLRLGRASGSVAYVFGAAPVEDPSKNLPGLWVEQDLFYFRKIRWPSQSELTVEELGNYPKNLVYPKTRTLRWGNQSAQMQTLSVVAKSPTTQPLQLLNLDPNRINTPEGLIQKNILLEFYKRFR